MYPEYKVYRFLWGELFLVYLTVTMLVVYQFHSQVVLDKMRTKGSGTSPLIVSTTSSELSSKSSKLSTTSSRDCKLFRTATIWTLKNLILHCASNMQWSNIKLVICKGQFSQLWSITRNQTVATVFCVRYSAKYSINLLYIVANWKYGGCIIMEYNVVCKEYI